MLTARDMVGEEWYHYPGEVDTLYKLAYTLPPFPLIVNIGIGFGTSTLAFYEARPDALIFAIDIAPCDKALENWLEAGVRPGRIVPIRGDSGNIGKHWRWSADLVLVDGSHTIQGVRADIEAWRGHVSRTNGIMVFHDYDNPITPHVKTVVDDMMTIKPYLHEGYIVAFRGLK